MEQCSKGTIIMLIIKLIRAHEGKRDVPLHSFNACIVPCSWVWDAMIAHTARVNGVVLVYQQCACNSSQTKRNGMLNYLVVCKTCFSCYAISPLAARNYIEFLCGSSFQVCIALDRRCRHREVTPQHPLTHCRLMLFYRRRCFFPISLYSHSFRLGRAHLWLHLQCNLWCKTTYYTHNQCEKDHTEPCIIIIMSGSYFVYVCANDSS